MRARSDASPDTEADRKHDNFVMWGVPIDEPNIAASLGRFRRLLQRPLLIVTLSYVELNGENRASSGYPELATTPFATVSHQDTGRHCFEFTESVQRATAATSSPLFSQLRLVDSCSYGAAAAAVYS